MRQPSARGGLGMGAVRRLSNRADESPNASLDKAAATELADAIRRRSPDFADAPDAGGFAANGPRSRRVSVGERAARVSVGSVDFSRRLARDEPHEPEREGPRRGAPRTAQGRGGGERRTQPRGEGGEQGKVHRRVERPKKRNNTFRKYSEYFTLRRADARDVCILFYVYLFHTPVYDNEYIGRFIVAPPSTRLHGRRRRFGRPRARTRPRALRRRPFESSTPRGARRTRRARRGSPAPPRPPPRGAVRDAVRDAVRSRIRLGRRDGGGLVARRATRARPTRRLRGRDGIFRRLRRRRRRRRRRLGSVRLHAARGFHGDERVRGVGARGVTRGAQVVRDAHRAPEPPTDHRRRAARATRDAEMDPAASRLRVSPRRRVPRRSGAARRRRAPRQLTPGAPAQGTRQRPRRVRAEAVVAEHGEAPRVHAAPASRASGRLRRERRRRLVRVRRWSSFFLGLLRSSLAAAPHHRAVRGVAGARGVVVDVVHGLVADRTRLVRAEVAASAGVSPSAVVFFFVFVFVFAREGGQRSRGARVVAGSPPGSRASARELAPEGLVQLAVDEGELPRERVGSRHAEHARR